MQHYRLIILVSFVLINKNVRSIGYFLLLLIDYPVLLASFERRACLELFASCTFTSHLLGISEQTTFSLIQFYVFYSKIFSCLP